MQIIEVQNLKKSFRTTWRGPRCEALRGVSFAVREGTCFGILGRNGAGKTTTLKVLTGLLRPDAGEVALLGAPATDASARRRLGYLPENPYFHEHLTPREGLALLGELAGLRRGQVEDRADDLLRRVGLADASQRRLRGFSKGMRQRFGLAAALIADPRLLLLDEPLSGLDPGGRRLLKQIVREERQRGKTVVLCSHVLTDVEELCDEVAVFHEGTVVRSGAINELLNGEPTHFELAVADVPCELEQRMIQAAVRHHRSGSRLSLEFAGAQSGPDFAAQVHAAGGRVLSLVPERESLEEWFVRLTDTAVEPMESAPKELVV